MYEKSNEVIAKLILYQKSSNVLKLILDFRKIKKEVKELIYARRYRLIFFDGPKIISIPSLKLV